jgi:hypothetical protein
MVLVLMLGKTNLLDCFEAIFFFNLSSTFFITGKEPSIALIVEYLNS